MTEKASLAAASRDETGPCVDATSLFGALASRSFLAVPRRALLSSSADALHHDNVFLLLTFHPKVTQLETGDVPRFCELMQDTLTSAAPAAAGSTMAHLRIQ